MTEHDVLFFYILLCGVVAGWQLCLLNFRFVIWMIRRQINPADLAVYEAKRDELKRFVNSSIAKRRAK